MTDDVLDALEEEYATTIRLALHKAVSNIPALDEPPRLEDLSYPTLSATGVDPLRHRRRLLLSAAAILVVVVAATATVVVQMRHSSLRTSAREVAPGWSLSGAAPIGSRSSAVLVSMGTDVLVWGGAPYQQNSSIGNAVRDGALYSPATDKWVVVSDAPITARLSAKAAWTGSLALIWGGVDDAGRSLDDGALFDPSTRMWRSIPIAPAGVSEPVPQWCGVVPR